MTDHLANWRNDLAVPWQQFFEGDPPLNFLGIPEALQMDDDAQVWPGRKPQGIEALAASHICRAFDGIAPVDVRVVVLGLDPYPNLNQATGRAFEQGNWDRRTQSLAPSLKPLMLAALATREGREDLFRARRWPEVRREITEEGLEFPALDAYFDNLAEQGVLFVNAAWTHTKPSDINRHLALWKPVVHHLLQKLARDAQGPLVFLLLGDDAQTVFTQSGAEAEAQNRGVEGNRIVRVDLPHPSRPARLFPQNPWLIVNENLGAPHINWWPQVL